MTTPAYKAKALQQAARKAACALLLCQAGASQAAEVAAIIPSNTGPYAEAYAGFRAAMQGPFELYDLSKPGVTAPEEARYAVAFGAKAAALQYPPGTHMVYALTPVTGRGRGWHEISMAPAPGPALAAFKGLQPELKRLAVFWTAYPGETYITRLRKAGEAAGIEIISSRLKNPDSFPERLRRLMGQMDAFWLMPDPALITQSSVMVLASFSCANSIPFYAPTYALVTSGATASFAPDFGEAGAAAARAAMALYNGEGLAEVTYVDKVSLRVNEELKAKCRWPLKK
ncbi:MAG: hypothetical protein A2X35_04780 [Elusimicrobia bacterium GWA2_61_42]|nr:MAG: hypothetical protein A2X35_04780 [Elusimicrobia bacterium GWA2_61_42]OGR77829.1 MAG: hypothetical protein A2X38_00245 [Elusimicrobia bacterium GWC2_61_25]